MKKLIAIILIISLVPMFALAATYYVKVGGDDAKDGLSEANAWASLTKLNATTFAAGSVIKLNKGDTWTGTWTLLGSGTSGTYNTITSYGTGSQPIIDANGGARAIFGNAKHYWKIDGIHVKNSTTANIQFSVGNGPQVLNSTSTGGGIGISIPTGTAPIISGNTIYQPASSAALFIAAAVTSGATVSGNTFIGTASANQNNGIDIRASNVTFNGNTATNWAGSSQTNSVFFLNVPTGLSASNNSVTDSVGNNFSLSSCASPVLANNNSTRSGGYGFILNGGSSASLTNTTIADSGSLGLSLQSVTGTSTVNNTVISGARTGHAAYFTSSNATVSGLTITNTLVGNGLRIDGTSVASVDRFSIFNTHAAECSFITGSANVTFTNGAIDRCGSDGLSSNGSATVTASYIYSNNTGSIGGAGAGDGYTAHATSVLRLDHCIAAGNSVSGITVVEGSSGWIRNCTFYNNYDATLADDYGINISTDAAATWDIKNNITKHHRTEIRVSAAAIAGGLTLTSDYNDFNDSRGGNAFIYNDVATTFSGWKTASSQDSHSTNADPQFVDPANGKFYLRSTSPAIDTGTDLGATYRLGLDKLSVWPSTVLLFGQGALWDMGAYPYRSYELPVERQARKAPGGFY